MSTFNEIKIKQLENDHSIKLQQFEAVADALRLTVNPIDMPKLKAQLTKLGEDIEQIEKALNVYKEIQNTTPNSTSFSLPRKVFFMADALPIDFVERPQEFEPIIAALVSSAQETVAITAALKDAGGYGKTTLARAICHDHRVREKFNDGILWVTLGEKITEHDLINKVLDLVVILIDGRPTVVTLEAAKNELKEAVAERALLLVVDDVWQAGHALPFLNLGSKISALITTRDKGVLSEEADLYSVDAMKSNEAIELLQSGLVKKNEPIPFIELKNLASRLGNWPLLLKLANGQLRKRISQGQTLAQALNWVERALTRKGFGALDDPNNPITRNRAAALSLGVSLELLSPGQRTKFELLAVFPKDQDIPFAALEKLWQMDDLDVEELGQRCVELSLLLRFNLRERVIRLHDVVRTYLCELQSPTLASHHAKFLLAYKVDNWYKLPEDEPYLWRWLAYHLREAKQESILRQLLLDFRFLQAKLRATDINVLLADFADTISDELLRLIESSLSMSAHIISIDKTQLAVQLHGRLLGYQYKQSELIPLLEAILFEQSYLQLLLPTLRQAGGALIRTLPLEGTGYAVALTDDREHLIVADETQVKVFVWRTGSLVSKFVHHTDLVTDLAVQGDLAFSASDDTTVKVWRWDTGELITTFAQHEGWVTGVSVQGDFAFSASRDNTVKVWRWDTGELITNFTAHTDWVYAVKVQGDLAFSASNDKTVRVWSWKTGEPITTFSQHTSGVYGLSVLGSWIFSSSSNTVVEVWSWETDKMLTTFAQHTDMVNKVSVLGELAFSASDDRTVKVWRWATGELVTTFTYHMDRVKTVSVKDELAFSASHDKTVRIWRWAMGELVATFKLHTDHVSGLSVQGKLAFSASDDKTVKVWNWETGEVLTNFTQHTSYVKSVTVQGDLAFSASNDNTVKVWQWANGEILITFKEHKNWANDVKVQDDLAFSSSWDKTVKVWRYATGEIISEFTGHMQGVAGISVQGDVVFSTSYDHTVKVWHWDNNGLITNFTHHTGPVNCVSVQGDVAISASDDKTIKVWRWATGEVLTDFLQHTHSVTGVTMQGKLAFLYIN
jgi:WD40 repeat protein